MDIHVHDSIVASCLRHDSDVILNVKNATNLDERILDLLTVPLMWWDWEDTATWIRHDWSKWG